MTKGDEVIDELTTRLYNDMLDRAARGVEDANPEDDEPIIDRIDLSLGGDDDNCRLICGLAYKMRHHRGMSEEEIEPYLRPPEGTLVPSTRRH